MCKPQKRGWADKKTVTDLRRAIGQQQQIRDWERVVICVNGYIKQGQKTPRQQIDEAIQWKSRYFEAKQTGKLKDITPK